MTTQYSSPAPMGQDPDDWWASPNLEPEVRTALARLVELELARRSISGAMVYFVVALLLAVSTPYYDEHPVILIGITCLMLVAGAARTISARRVIGQPAVEVPGAYRVLHGSVYATTVLWGLFCAWTLWLYPVQWTGMFLMLSTAALASGLASSMAPHLRLAYHTLLLMVTPTIVTAVWLGDRSHVAFGAATAIYLAFLLAQAKGNCRAFWSASVAMEREKIRGSAERQRAERERATLAAAIEQAAEEILITDTQGNIQYCNSAFQRHTGYSKEEVAGRNPRFLKSGNHEPAYYAELWATITSRRIWTGRFTNRKKDGSVYEVDGTISAIHDPSGKHVGFVSARRDVTDRLRLEAQLRQSQKLESVGRLAGGVAHDFNNLLTVIIGYSRLLLQEPADDAESCRSYAEEIRSAGERAANLTKQLLSFSRKQLLVLKPVALDELVAEMRPMLQQLVGEDVKLVVITAPSLATVRADADQMSQILLNLAANARDAMPQGGSLTIRMDNVEPSKVLLAVSDTGVGMDEETRQRVFEPFFTTKDEGHGTGLGLATVYGIVQQSGGQVEVQSEFGSGSTFNIYLPRMDATAVSGTIPEPRPAPLGGSETVLVVEDREDLRKLVVRVLQARGFRVLEAENGPAALAVGTEFAGTIHLMLTDVIMPDLNGRQVADAMALARPEMRILFMSGYSGEVIAQRGILEEGVAYLAKPFTMEALVEKVRSVLDE